MFGFQRTGDAMWAAADQMARGFFLGATAGRTTLTGEGLQHADGHSPLLAATNPAVVSPTTPPTCTRSATSSRTACAGCTATAARTARGENVMYYITLYNEPYVQPAEPEGLDVEGVLKGMHLAHPGSGDGPRVQLLASGVAVPWALEAQQLLRDDWGVVADVWSVTSWSELRRDGHGADAEAFSSLGSRSGVCPT